MSDSQKIIFFILLIGLYIGLLSLVYLNFPALKSYVLIVLILIFIN